MSLLVLSCIPERDNPWDPNGEIKRQRDQGAWDLAFPDQGSPYPDSNPWTPDQPPLTPDLQPPSPDMPPTGGNFGDKCSSGGSCNSPYTCVMMGTATTNGFCTKSCVTSGNQCSGSPTGTYAACVLQDTNKQLFCAFMCKIGTQSWSCPGAMTCSPSENPAGSGQYPCLP